MEISFNKLVQISVIFALLLHIGHCLECYACVNQDSNKDKCIKTTKQCEEHQDVCTATVGWGLPPYWVPYGDRMHFVSKDCDTRSACEKRQADNMRFCKRDWFDDWSCIECCSGDLCNYYVTLTASSNGASTFFIVGISLFISAFHQW